MHLRPDTYLIDDTKPSAPFMRDISWIEDHGFGFFQVNVLLTQTGTAPLHSPEALAWMSDLRDFAERDPLVTHVAGLPDFFTHLRRAALGPDAVPLPQSIEESSQLLLMAQLQDPAFVDDLYRETDRVAQVMIAVRDEGSQLLDPFLTRLSDYVADHPFPVGSAELTGTVTMIHSFTKRLLRSFGPSIIIAIVLITAIMMWMFQSVRLGLVALLPNLFPLLVVLGATAALGYGLKPSTILVLSIAFGIAVDDTIHLMSRVARHACGSGCISSGLPAGIQEAGVIMIVTTGLVSAGFLLLTASHFEVLYLIGLMTAVSAVTALAADLFVLPSIVSLAEAWTPAARPAPKTAQGEVS
jgi:predicted RND superfamily exporter protein